MNRSLFLILAAVASPALAQNQPAKPAQPAAKPGGDMTFQGEIVKNRRGDAIKATALIPREVLFGNPERARVTISHDGKSLAWLAPQDGVMNVWVSPANDLKAAKCITADKLRGIRQYQWAYNGQILYQQDDGGD